MKGTAGLPEKTKIAWSKVFLKAPLLSYNRPSVAEAVLQTHCYELINYLVHPL